MLLKDHYKTLQIPATASIEDIKKAYRKLAQQYHPDKNYHNTNLFHEIQEAYFILSNNKGKKIYDEERYFSGLSSRKEPRNISASWILQLAMELRKHTDHVDGFRMNHQALMTMYY